MRENFVLVAMGVSYPGYVVYRIYGLCHVVILAVKDLTQSTLSGETVHCITQLQEEDGARVDGACRGAAETSAVGCAA